MFVVLLFCFVYLIMLCRLSKFTPTKKLSFYLYFSTDFRNKKGFLDIQIAKRGLTHSTKSTAVLFLES